MTVDTLTSRGPVAGLTISAHGTPNASVDVAAGLGCYDGQGVPVGAVTNVDILTGNPADSVQHRYDWMVFSSTGAVSVIVGTLGDPAPDYSLLGSSAPIGYVFVDAGVTAVTQGAITMLPYTTFVQPANCLFYTYGGTGSDADPGTGIFTTDGSTLGAVTKIYVNYTSLGGEAERWLTQEPPFYLRFWSKKYGSSSYVVYEVTAITKHTGYDTLAVSLVDEGGPRGTAGAPGGWTVATILSTDAGDTVIERSFGPAVVTNVNGQSTLGGDVTLTPVNTMVDVFNTGSLAAGTYLVTATVHALGSAAGHVVTARLWDGSTTYAEAEQVMGATNAIPMSLDAVVVLAAAATLKVSAASDTGTTDKVKAAVTKNSAGNFATILTWVRIA